MSFNEKDREVLYTIEQRVQQLTRIEQILIKENVKLHKELEDLLASVNISSSTFMKLKSILLRVNANNENLQKAVEQNNSNT